MTMRALGVDYGRRRIGLALSDPSGLLARPWKAVDAAGRLEAVAAGIAAEVEGLRREGELVDVIVLGFPRRLSGEPNEQTPLVDALARHLRELVPGVAVALQDERLSSREAESILARREKSWKRRKPLLDATAAAVILQDYLDARRPLLEAADLPPG